MPLGIVGQIVAFAAACLVSAKFYAGILAGHLGWSAIKSAAASVRRKIGA